MSLYGSFQVVSDNLQVGFGLQEAEMPGISIFVVEQKFPTET